MSLLFVTASSLLPATTSRDWAKPPSAHLRRRRWRRGTRTPQSAAHQSRCHPRARSVL